MHKDCADSKTKIEPNIQKLNFYLKILETKANQGAQNYALPPYPIKKDSLQQKSKSKVDIFTLIDAINTVTQEIQKVLQSMLVTLTKAKREDALPISKLVTQIVTVNFYIFFQFF